jgi:hypothetical protein
MTALLEIMFYGVLSVTIGELLWLLLDVMIDRDRE